MSATHGVRKRALKSVVSKANGAMPPKRPLHRISQVRRRQGVSIRTAARRLKIDLKQAKEEQVPTADLTLSELYEWQKILDVPVQELLIDNDAPLSAPVLMRAQMVKLMKTVVTIKENAREKPVQRLANMLYEQLVEVMPELAEVGPWHGQGHGQGYSRYGRILQFQIPEALLSPDQ